MLVIQSNNRIFDMNATADLFPAVPNQQMYIIMGLMT